MYLRACKQRDGIRLTLVESYREDGKVKRRHLASIGNTASQHAYTDEQIRLRKRSMWFRLLVIRKWWTIPDDQWKRIVAAARPHLGVSNLDNLIAGPVEDYEVSESGGCISSKIKGEPDPQASKNGETIAELLDGLL